MLRAHIFLSQNLFDTLISLLSFGLDVLLFLRWSINLHDYLIVVHSFDLSTVRIQSVRQSISRQTDKRISRDADNRLIDSIK